MIIGRLSAVLLAALVATGGTAAAAGDAGSGEKIFKKSCGACHGIKAGERKAGPALNGILGRKAGTVAGYKYSKANSESDLVWQDQVLDEYLADPRAKIPGTTMAFAGIKDAQDRADLVAYLKAVK